GLVGGGGRDGVGGQGVEAVFGPPWLGLEPGELEFHGQSRVAGALYVGNVSVDTGREGLENFLGVGAVAAILLRHVAPVSEAPRVHIALNRRRAEDLGQASLSGAFPQFHLEESVLGSDEALGAKDSLPSTC